MHVTYGLGRDVDVIGSLSVYGFGILELFPEGLIAQIADKVHREFRIMAVEYESRGCEVEYDDRGFNTELED